MRNINKVFVSGNLCRDLEVKQVTEKFTVGTTSIAVNRSVKQADGTYKDVADFYDLRFFNNTAVALAPHLKKGTTAYIEGRLSVDKWEKDGQKFSRVYIDVENINFNNKRPEAADGGEAFTQNAEPIPTGADGFPEDFPF